MKRLEDIEKLIKNGKPEIKTDEQMDKLTLNGSLTVMEETVRNKSLCSKFGILTLLMRNKIAFSTVATAIILTLGLLMIQSGKEEKVEITKITSVAQSPAEMLTLRSLKIAYYNGGIEAVETQCDNAIEKLGIESKRITVQELLADINGT